MATCNICGSEVEDLKSHLQEQADLGDEEHLEALEQSPAEDSPSTLDNFPEN